MCAVVGGGQVVMGGDSAASTSEGDQTLRSPKVFARRGWLFGGSGEMRINQLLQHVFDVPPLPDGADVEAFVIGVLAGSLERFLGQQASSLLPTLDDDELWSLLVAGGGRLFRICSHFSVSESVTGYDAIGGGGPQALGSLASTEDRTPEERVQTALAAAARHHGSVAPPFVILSTEGARPATP